MYPNFPWTLNNREAIRAAIASTPPPQTIIPSRYIRDRVDQDGAPTSTLGDFESNTERSLAVTEGGGDSDD
jgi:hypothetical protein